MISCPLARYDLLTPLVLNRVLQQHCPAHLSENYTCVFDNVRQLQRFVSTLAYNQLVAPTTVWNQDLTVIQCRSIQVRIDKLVEGIQSMASSLRTELYSFSNGKPLECSIPATFADDLTSTRRGDSWILSAHTNPREHALVRFMMSNGTWNLTQMENGKTKWNLLACEEFMCKAARIVALIATLVHIGAGPPCRGTEQMADQISNSTQPRTLYLVHGQLLTIRRHTKSTHATGLDAFNICFFPKVLTELITYYLLVVRPLERVVGEVLYGPNAAGIYDVYLFVRHGARIPSDTFSTILEEVTLRFIGVALSLNPLRHIMVAFQREYVDESRLPFGNNIGDLISAHTTHTANRFYGREPGLVEGMTASILLDIGEWCDQYHNKVGLGNRKGPLIPLRIQRKQARELGDLSYLGSGSQLENLIRALLREIQETTFKSAIQHLQPFIREVIERKFAETCTHIIAETVAKAHRHHPGEPQSSHPIQTQRSPQPGEAGSRMHAAHDRPMQVPPTQAPHPPSNRPIQTRRPPQPRVAATRMLAAPGTPRQLLRSQAPQLSNESVVPGTARGLKRTTTEVYDGEEEERETSGSKRRDAQGRSQNTQGRQGPQQTGLNLDVPSGQTDQALEQPGDQPQTVDNRISGSLTRSSTHREPAAGLVSQLRPEGENVMRPNSPDVDTPDVFDYLGARPDPPDVDNPSEPEVLTRPNSPDEDDLYQSDVPTRPDSPSEYLSQLLYLTLGDREPTRARENALKGLRIIFRNPNAQFKSAQQERMVTNVLEGFHATAVIPTGGGKSMAFEVPPAVAEAITVVILPFKAIIAQVVRTARRRGLNVEQWVSATVQDPTNTRLVVVAVETATNSGFLR
jgi:hypothetical protein